MPTILSWVEKGERDIPVIPQWVDNLDLAANTAETYTVPATVRYLVLSCDAVIFARIGGTASVPSADVVNGTASFGLGTEAIVAVAAGQQISFIAASAAQLQIGCFTARA